MKNRIVALILSIVTVLLTLASCAVAFPSGTPDNGTGTNGDGTGGDGSTGGNGGASNNGKYGSLVYVDTDIDLYDIRQEMMDIVGTLITVNHISTAPDVDSEVVFGDTERPVTLAAKAELEKQIADSEGDNVGYIIYSDGSNIAVYWQQADMMDIALNDFLNACVAERQLQLQKETVVCKIYDRRSYETDKHWIKLEATASSEVVAALKRLNSYYESVNIVDWMANLWDPDIGAFYYSISARDNEPFRPDIESTSQILSLLVSSGALKNKNDLPADIKTKILNFVLNTQSKNDGYFYHPQWPQDKNLLNTDRYGRDLSRATGIISDLNIDVDGDGIEDDIYPFYCAPNGKKCEAHQESGECTFPIADSVSYVTANMDSRVTGALGSAVSAAVSNVSGSYVSAVAVSSHPDYSSREAFKTWLYAYNATIKEDSGKAHNLSAISSEIASHGYTDIVVEQIMTAQREVYEEQTAAGVDPTGLWQRNVDYNAVWGILKYASYFNGKYWTTPMDMEYIRCMVKTCIKVIALPADGAYYANDIYNMWNAIDRILTHVEKHYGKEEIQEIHELLRENAASLIENSLSKLEPFKRADGSFSYRSDGRSLATIYGSSISLGAVEGDVNAVALCCQMYEGVFRALGYDEVPLFTSVDGERFIETLQNSEPIDKIETEVGIVDFEDGEIPYGTSVSIGTSGGKGVVEEDPADSANSAFLFSSEAGTSSNVKFKTAQLGAGCYIFDSDMYVSSESTVTGYVFQVFLADAYIVAFKLNSDGTVTIGDDKDGSGLAMTFGTVDMDTWFRLTVQMYIPDEINGLDEARIKVWIDNEYCGESGNFYSMNGNGTLVEGYDFVKLWSMKRGDTDIYFDNCYFAVDSIDYDESNDTFEDVRAN